MGKNNILMYQIIIIKYLGEKTKKTGITINLQN